MEPVKRPVDNPVPFEPRRFQSAVPYYERYRLGYPQRLIARVTALLELTPGDAVLDLGCGPGSLSVPFAKAGMNVTAVDPEPEMLAEAQMAAVFAHLEGLGELPLEASVVRQAHEPCEQESLDRVGAFVECDGGIEGAKADE